MKRGPSLPWYVFVLRLLGACAVVVVIVLIALMVLGPIIGNTFSATPLPVIPVGTTSTLLPTAQDPFTEIDKSLADSVQSSIAYNAPQTMVLDQVTTVELLMNPSLSLGALATQVTPPGPVVTASIEVTPRMKAELKPDDPAAFIIQPVQDNPVQLISGSETTSWRWSVTPKKGGLQGLTLVVYREIQYQGQDYWRSVKSYQANINVQVTLGQRIADLDWKWILGIVLPLIAIPAFWRWYDRKRQKNTATKGHSHSKTGG